MIYDSLLCNVPIWGPEKHINVKTNQGYFNVSLGIGANTPLTVPFENSTGWKILLIVKLLEQDL
jgi:hypothetical protein